MQLLFKLLNLIKRFLSSTFKRFHCKVTYHSLSSVYCLEFKPFLNTTCQCLLVVVFVQSLKHFFLSRNKTKINKQSKKEEKNLQTLLCTAFYVHSTSNLGLYNLLQYMMYTHCTLHISKSPPRWRQLPWLANPGMHV